MYYSSIVNFCVSEIFIGVTSSGATVNGTVEVSIDGKTCKIYGASGGISICATDEAIAKYSIDLIGNGSGGDTPEMGGTEIVIHSYTPIIKKYTLNGKYINLPIDANIINDFNPTAEFLVGTGIDVTYSLFKHFTDAATDDVVLSTITTTPYYYEGNRNVCTLNLGQDVDFLLDFETSGIFFSNSSFIAIIDAKNTLANLEEVPEGFHIFETNPDVDGLIITYGDNELSSSFANITLKGTGDKELKIDYLPLDFAKTKDNEYVLENYVHYIHVPLFYFFDSTESPESPDLCFLINDSDNVVQFKKGLTKISDNLSIELTCEKKDVSTGDVINIDDNDMLFLISSTYIKIGVADSDYTVPSNNSDVFITKMKINNNQKKLIKVNGNYSDYLFYGNKTKNTDELVFQNLKLLYGAYKEEIDPKVSISSFKMIDDFNSPFIVPSMMKNNVLVLFNDMIVNDYVIENSTFLPNDEGSYTIYPIGKIIKDDGNVLFYCEKVIYQDVFNIPELKTLEITFFSDATKATATASADGEIEFSVSGFENKEGYIFYEKGSSETIENILKAKITKIEINGISNDLLTYSKSNGVIIEKSNVSPPPPPPSDKDNIVLIVVIIVISLLIFIGIVAYFIYKHMQNKKKNENN